MTENKILLSVGGMDIYDQELALSAIEKFGKLKGKTGGKKKSGKLRASSIRDNDELEMTYLVEKSPAGNTVHRFMAEGREPCTFLNSDVSQGIAEFDVKKETTFLKEDKEQKSPYTSIALGERKRRFTLKMFNAATAHQPDAE